MSKEYKLNIDMQMQDKYSTSIDKLKKDLLSVSQAFDKIEQSSQSMSDKVNTALDSKGTTQKYTEGMDKANKSIEENTKKTKKAKEENESFGKTFKKTMGNALSSVATWGVATTAIYGTQRAMRELHSVMLEVDQEMIALRRVMDKTTTDFQEMQKTASTLGIDYATNIQEVVQSMVQWGRQGKEQIEVLQLTEAALLATNVAEMEAKQSVDLLTAAVLQFNLEASEATGIVDKLNEVANNYATTAEDLAMSIRESGAAANNAGISIDELIGMTTALTASTAKSGNRIGRALRTVFSRMMGDAQGTGEALGKVEVALNSVGIAVRKDETTYRNLTDVMTDLASSWHDMDQVMQANIARAMGGRRRYSDVISLIENWDMALGATTSSMNSFNSAVEENETYMESMQAKWQQVKNEFQNIAVTLESVGVGEFSKDVAEFAAGALNSVSDLIVGIDKLKWVLAGLGTVGGLSKITKMFSSLNSTTQLSQGAMGLNSLSMGVENISKLAKIQGKLSTASNKISSIASKINFNIVGIGIAVAGITALVSAYGDYSKQLEEASDKKEKFNKLIEKGNSLSSEELKNTQEVIDGSMNQLKEYEKYAKMVNSNEISMNDLSIIGQDDFLGVATTKYEKIKSMFALVDRNKSKQLVNASEAVIQLRMAFSDLSDKHKDVESFIKAVNRELLELQNTLDNTALSQIEFTKSLLNNTISGRRELKVLNSQIKRYEELYKIKDKTERQQLEMSDIENNLQRDHYELGGLNNEELIKEGNKIAQEISKKIRIDTTKALKEAESSIINKNGAIKENTERIKTLRKTIEQYDKQLIKLKNSEEENADAILKTKEKRRKAQAEYISLIEQKEKINQKNKEMIELQETLNEGENNSRLLFQFEEADKLFEDLGDQIAKVSTKLKDFKSNLNIELQVSQLKSSLLNLGFEETLSNEVSILEKNRDELFNYIEEIENISNKAKSSEMKDSIKELLESEDGINADNMIGLDKVIANWDHQSLEEQKNALKSALIKTIEELNTTVEKKSKDLNITEGILEGITKIDTSNYKGIIGSSKALDQFHKNLEFAKSSINDLKKEYSQLTEKDVDNLMGKLGYSEKEITKLVKTMNDQIRSTQTAWADAITGAIDSSLNDSNLNSVFDKIQGGLRSVLSTAFSNQGMKSDMESLISSFSQSISQNSQGLSQGIMSGLENFSGGGSIAGSVMSGIGTALMSSGNPFGMALGAVSKIGETIWGGTSGEEYIGQVETANSTQKQLNSQLEKFGLDMQTINAKVKNSANFWEKMWGGADYKAVNLDKANEQIEKMQDRLKGVQNTFSSLGSSFADTLKNATSYTEFATHFKQSIGGALKNAVVDSLLKSSAIEGAVKKLSAQVYKAAEDGIVTNSELDSLKGIYNGMQSSMQNAYSIIEQLNQSGFMSEGVSVDNTSNEQRTFQAGSTSNITYNQQFVVKSQAFNGSREEAEEFAHLIAPYIKEELERVG
jgi:TP901 family phage tail tape measure protein